MKKDYEVKFYMKNRDTFEIIFKNTTREEILDTINKTNVMGHNNTFIGNEKAEYFINLSEINYFHIEELNEDMEEEN